MLKTWCKQWRVDVGGWIILSATGNWSGHCWTVTLLALTTSWGLHQFIYHRELNGWPWAQGIAGNWTHYRHVTLLWFRSPSQLDQEFIHCAGLISLWTILDLCVRDRWQMLKINYLIIFVLSCTMLIWFLSRDLIWAKIWWWAVFCNLFGLYGNIRLLSSCWSRDIRYGIVLVTFGSPHQASSYQGNYWFLCESQYHFTATLFMSFFFRCIKH